MEYNEENEDYYIKFMTKKKDGSYTWPKRNGWETWVPASDISKVVDNN
jgi:hypothetical protein